jgi:hypothetical protein
LSQRLKNTNYIDDYFPQELTAEAIRGEEFFNNGQFFEQFEEDFKMEDVIQEIKDSFKNNLLFGTGLINNKFT